MVARLSNRQPTLLSCAFVHFMFSPIENSHWDREYRFEQPESPCILHEIKSRG
jgi:hypothetical protein